MKDTECVKGVKFGRNNVMNLWYAGDVALMAYKRRKRQNIADRLSETWKLNGM